MKKFKRVKMLFLAAGPDGVLNPGQEVLLDEKEADAYIDGKYAVEIVASSKTAEKAVAVSASEKAVALEYDDDKPEKSKKGWFKKK